jgi:hypothetical protein
MKQKNERISHYEEQLKQERIQKLMVEFANHKQTILDLWSDLEINLELNGVNDSPELKAFVWNSIAEVVCIFYRKGLLVYYYTNKMVQNDLRSMLFEHIAFTLILSRRDKAQMIKQVNARIRKIQMNTEENILYQSTRKTGFSAC